MATFVALRITVVGPPHHTREHDAVRPYVAALVPLEALTFRNGPQSSDAGSVVVAADADVSSTPVLEYSFASMR